jgi:glucokinase
MTGAIVAFDVGGTNLRSARYAPGAEGLGTLTGHDTCPTPFGDEAGLVAALVDQARAQGEGAGAPLAAVGLAMKGFCNVRLGVVHGCRGLGLHDDVALTGPMQDALGVPVRLVNDVNAAALSEARAADLCELAVLFVGTGVGTGLVSGGRLLEGHRGCAAEGGHIIFREGGIPYASGAAGCYEAYLGGEALSQRARDAGVAEDTAGLLERWRAGDPAAAPIMEDALAAMGSLARLLVGLLDPERIVVGGGVAARCPELLEAARAALDPHPMLPRAGAVEVQAARGGDEAGLLGAALLAADLI